MSKGRERLPKSAAIHRRRALAKSRKGELVGLKISFERLFEIRQKLAVDEIDPKDRACLKTEEIWLKFRVGEIDQAERVNELTGLLESLEITHPEVYQWLVEPDGNGVSPLAEIRDEVMPLKTGGYYTKRRL